MPADGNVVRRICEDHLRALPVQQYTNGLSLKRVATDQPMLPKLPHVANAATNSCLENWQPLFSRIAAFTKSQALDK